MSDMGDQQDGIIERAGQAGGRRMSRRYGKRCRILHNLNLGLPYGASMTNRVARDGAAR